MTAAHLQAGALGALRLANRIVLAPMSRMQADEDGLPTQAMSDYYAGYARSGVGLVITEAVYTDAAHSRAYFRQPGIADARQARAWARIAGAVHAAGRPVLMQLQHAGRLAEPGLHACALGPTEARAQGLAWQTQRPYAEAPVRAAGASDIEALVRGFADAARRARVAGFDGVELHGARGYLLDGFLSESALGDLEARLRVPLAVLRAVREAMPDGLLSWNLSLYKMDDYRYQPPGGRAEIEAIARALVAAGADVLHVTTRRALRAEPWGETLARTVREAVPDCALIANGGLHSGEDCDAALAHGGAQAVSLARALLANPDWFARLREGRALRAYAPGMEAAPLSC